jgi:tRNA(fMet)-specific endonuclease VapC
VCISVITKSELLFGVEVSPRRQQDRAALDEYLRHVEVLDFPDEAALHYAQIRAALKARGTMIGANDVLIAARARSLKLTLVTNNTQEFGRVPELHIENWTEWVERNPVTGWGSYLAEEHSLILSGDKVSRRGDLASPGYVQPRNHLVTSSNWKSGRTTLGDVSRLVCLGRRVFAESRASGERRDA